MPRVALDLNKEEDRAKVGGTWRRAMGLVPGEPNQGLVAEMLESPARLKDYDDSSWDVITNVRELLSVGLTFAWWRINVTIPEELDGMKLEGSTCVFETNVDNHGEIYVDGETDYLTQVFVGFNAQQRVVVNPSVTPGTTHTLAILAANGPLAIPRGGVFMRYATLAFETRGG